MSAVLDHRIQIRTMSEPDIDAVLGIERSAYDFPWSGNIFTECMKAGYVCRVCVNDAELAGYGIMAVGAGECHIMNLCVHPEQSGNGFGSLLMEDLLGIATRAKAHIAFLEVRTSNRRAHALYQYLGFNEVGMRKNYYPAKKGREDAYVLAKTMD
jgi:[ribosomal protein S18]-alanine N-acetyltransferase